MYRNGAPQLPRCCLPPLAREVAFDPIMPNYVGCWDARLHHYAMLAPSADRGQCNPCKLVYGHGWKGPLARKNMRGRGGWRRRCRALPFGLTLPTPKGGRPRGPAEMHNAGPRTVHLLIWVRTPARFPVKTDVSTVRGPRTVQPPSQWDLRPSQRFDFTAAWS